MSYLIFMQYMMCKCNDSQFLNSWMSLLIFCDFSFEVICRTTDLHGKARTDCIWCNINFVGMCFATTIEKQCRHVFSSQTLLWVHTCSQWQIDTVFKLWCIVRSTSAVIVYLLLVSLVLFILFLSFIVLWFIACFVTHCLRTVCLCCRHVIRRNAFRSCCRFVMGKWAHCFAPLY